MKTIIAGSRELTRRDLVSGLSQLPWKITEVISGGARGIDRYAIEYAHDLNIPVKVFEADWKNMASPTYSLYHQSDKAAGYRRNTKMAEYAEALLAVWDGESKGTAHMISEARRFHLRVYIHVPFSS